MRYVLVPQTHIHVCDTLSNDGMKRLFKFGRRLFILLQKKVKDIKTATVKLTILTKAVMFYDVWYLVTISTTTWRFLILTLCFKVMTCAQHSVLYLSSHQTCSVCPRFVNYRKIKGKRTVSIRYCLIFARIFSLEQTSR